MKFYMDVWKRYVKYTYDYVDGFDITRNFSFQTQLHGGFSSATVTIMLPANRAQYLYNILLGCHCEIRDSYYNLVYEGYVRELTRAGAEITMNLTGYYAHAGRLLDDRIYITSPTTVQTVVEDAADLIDSWNAPIPMGLGANYDLMVTDPETGSYIPLDFTDITIKEALERSLNYGYSTTQATPAYIAVYDNRTPYIMTSYAQTLYKYMGFHVFLYNIRGLAGTSISLDEVKNKIYAVYANEGEGPSKTTAASDTFSISKYGTIEGLVQNGGNPEGLALAQDLRDYALSVYAWPRNNIQVEVSGDIQHFSGATYAPYNIRAGHHVRFSDLDLVYSDSFWMVEGPSLARYMTFVVGTNYNSNSDSTTITVGVDNKTFEIMMSRLGLSGGLK